MTQRKHREKPLTKKENPTSDHVSNTEHWDLVVYNISYTGGDQKGTANACKGNRSVEKADAPWKYYSEGKIKNTA